MKTRIWYQSMTPIHRLPNYVKALETHARQVCSTGVEVRFNGLPDAWFTNLMPGEIFRYTYAKHVIQNEVIQVCQEAESNGYDVVVLGSFAASFLTEIRSALRIPVVSMAESVLLVSSSVADSVGVVCLAPSQVSRIQAVLSTHASSARIRSVDALQQPLHEGTLDALFKDPSSVIEEFSHIARTTVAAGADAVIPAEGVLSELLFANNVRLVDEAPVIDVVGVSLLYAELMVNLKRRIGLETGRRWAYATPTEDVLRALHDGRAALRAQ